MVFVESAPFLWLGRTLLGMAVVGWPRLRPTRRSELIVHVSSRVVLRSVDGGSNRSRQKRSFPRNIAHHSLVRAITSLEVLRKSLDALVQGL